jgi:hypothetical protein
MSKVRPSRNESALALMTSIAAGVAIAALMRKGGKRSALKSLGAGFACSLQTYPLACKVTDALVSIFSTKEKSEQKTSDSLATNLAAD